MCIKHYRSKFECTKVIDILDRNDEGVRVVHRDIPLKKAFLVHQNDYIVVADYCHLHLDLRHNYVQFVFKIQIEQRNNNKENKTKNLPERAFEMLDFSFPK